MNHVYKNVEAQMTPKNKNIVVILLVKKFENMGRRRGFPFFHLQNGALKSDAILEALLIPVPFEKACMSLKLFKTGSENLYHSYHLDDRFDRF